MRISDWIEKGVDWRSGCVVVFWVVFNGRRHRESGVYDAYLYRATGTAPHSLWLVRDNSLVRRNVVPWAAQRSG